MSCVVQILSDCSGAFPPGRKIPPTSDLCGVSLRRCRPALVGRANRAFGVHLIAAHSASLSVLVSLISVSVRLRWNYPQVEDLPPFSALFPVSRFAKIVVTSTLSSGQQLVLRTLTQHFIPLHEAFGGVRREGEKHVFSRSRRYRETGGTQCSS